MLTITRKFWRLLVNFAVYDYAETIVEPWLVGLYTR